MFPGPVSFWSRYPPWFISSGTAIWRVFLVLQFFSPKFVIRIFFVLLWVFSPKYSLQLVPYFLHFSTKWIFKQPFQIRLAKIGVYIIFDWFVRLAGSGPSRRIDPFLSCMGTTPGLGFEGACSTNFQFQFQFPPNSIFVKRNFLCKFKFVMPLGWTNRQMPAVCRSVLFTDLSALPHILPHPQCAGAAHVKKYDDYHLNFFLFKKNSSFFWLFAYCNGWPWKNYLTKFRRVFLTQ